MAFNNSSQVHIGGNANNVVHGIQNNYVDYTDADILRLLADRSAPNACYNSEQRFPPPNCHEGTRVQLIQKLSRRIEDDTRTSSVLWLHGTAGVGKSAIAQHLAEKYARNGRLGAAFFFSRNDGTRDNISPFVASLAYQFCKEGTSLGVVLTPAIIQAIRSDPTIFTKTCEAQLRELIIQPCSTTDNVQESPQNVIIIDGLDECVDRASQERVIRIILDLISTPSSCWIILVCSRPEPQIRRGFAAEDFDLCLETFDINTLDDVNQDIEKYLNDSFTSLRHKYQEDPSWPGRHVIGNLVQRADGQFIFASTIVKYLDTDDEMPQDRLDTILRIYVDTASDSPYSTLDLLYRQILSTCRTWNKVKTILRLLVRRKKDPRVIALALNVQAQQLKVLLVRLHAVLLIPMDLNWESIEVAHASFSEFLCDPNRSGAFYIPDISDAEHHDLMATVSLRALLPFAKDYPLYHPRPFTSEAASRWFERVSSDGFLVTSLDDWKRHCLYITSPSEDLLAELQKLDIYALVAMSSCVKLRGLLSSWNEIIPWAKALGNPKMLAFGKRLEFELGMLSQEMRVAVARDMPIKVFSSSFALEEALYSESFGQNFIDDLLKTTVDHISNLHLNVLVIPPGSIVAPEECFVMHLMRYNAALFDRMSDRYSVNTTLVPSAASSRSQRADKIRLLVSCIKDSVPTNDQCWSDPLGYEDFMSFATLLRERMEALSLEFPETSSLKLVQAVRRDDQVRSPPPQDSDDDDLSYHSACDSPPPSPDSDSFSV